MTVETETLAEAAQRFATVIQAERASTLEALEAERKAAVQIIEALRREYARRSRVNSGRFVLGFLAGAAIGAVAVSMLAPRSGEETRLNLASGVGSAGAGVGDRLRAALDAGKRAATSREQELWSQFRKRLADGNKPADTSYGY